MSGRPARRYLAFVSAIVIVAVLISAGLFLTFGQAAKSHTDTVTTSTMTKVPTCVAPPPPVQKITQVGVPPFAFVGPDAACAEVVPAVPGSVSLANFTITLNATRPLHLTMVFFDNDNGVSSIPPGTTFTATDGIPNTSAAGPLAIQRNVANATVIAIPGGETTFRFQASVPNPFKAGTYFFDVYIFVSSKDTVDGGGYGYSVPVNLDAR